MEQSLGVHPGNTAPGFPPGIVGGATHLGDAVADQAKADLTTAYNDAAGRTPFTNLPAELGGSTLTPGIYRIGAAQLTGQLTLNLQNDPDAVFIFQIDSTLITASASSVIFINGASPCNVYWQVGSSATLGTGTDFLGNIMASTSITMNTGATLEGRAMAQTGSVTLDTNVITEPDCAQAPPPTDGPTSPTDEPTDEPTDGPGGPGGNGGNGGPGGPDGPGEPDGSRGPGGSDGDGTGANGSADGSGYGDGLPVTGNETLATVVAVGLAFLVVGVMLTVLSWRRARES